MYSDIAKNKRKTVLIMLVFVGLVIFAVTGTDWNISTAQPLLPTTQALAGKLLGVGGHLLALQLDDQLAPFWFVDQHRRFDAMPHGLEIEVPDEAHNALPLIYFGADGIAFQTEGAHGGFIDNDRRPRRVAV